MPTYKLRDNQQIAVNAAVEWMKKNSEPALLAQTGAFGKSPVLCKHRNMLFLCVHITQFM